MGHDTPRRRESITATAVTGRQSAHRVRRSRSTTRPRPRRDGRPERAELRPGAPRAGRSRAADTTSAARRRVPRGRVRPRPSFGACSGGSASHAVTNRPGGSYTFAVRAAATPADLSPATRTRTVAIDATPPETTVTSGPSDETRPRTPRPRSPSAPARRARYVRVPRLPGGAHTAGILGVLAARAAHREPAFSPRRTYSFEVRADGTPSATPTRRPPSGPSAVTAPVHGDDPGPAPEPATPALGRGPAETRRRKLHGDHGRPRPGRITNTTVLPFAPAADQLVRLQGCEDPLHRDSS